MASFEEKVEALRRLQEKREARAADKREAQSATISSTVAVTEEAQVAAKSLEDRELPAVLEHYAGLEAPSSGSSNTVKDDAEDEADALYCLGHCFEQGLHECEKDTEKAVKYYRMSAEKGSVVGRWRLGHLFEYGNGVEKNLETAAHWYRLAAEGGHMHAQSALALLLEDNHVDAQEAGEPFRWHLAAAAQGNALSQYCAACCLAEGRLTDKDEETAKALLKMSADAGFPLAMEAFSAQRSSTKCGDDEQPEAEDGKSLLDMAARVAKQIEHLPDGEAEAFLDELLGSFDEISAFDGEDFQKILAGIECSDLDLDAKDCLDAPLLEAWAAATPCTAAA